MGPRAQGAKTRRGNRKGAGHRLCRPCITFDEGHGCQTRTAAGWRGLGPELLLRGGGPLAVAASLRGEGPVEATTRGEPSLPPDSLPPDSLRLWAETMTTMGDHQNKLTTTWWHCVNGPSLLD